MRVCAAAIQMPSALLDVSTNVERADAWLRQAHDAGVELAVLPEMFNTGSGFCRDSTTVGESHDGPTVRLLRERSRLWGMDIAAGFVERDGHHLYDSLLYVTPEGRIDVYRKRHLVFWERFRFRPGRDPVIVPTRWGRVGLAICADMIYRRVWLGYRDRIDLAIVSAAWPDFTDRRTGRKHWLLGHVGPLSATIPSRVAEDLGIPVIFANQCGPTRTVIPVIWQRIEDRFAGLSSICDGRHGPPVQSNVEEGILVAPITIHSAKGPKTWRSTSHSGRGASSSVSAR
ncbi:MAG: carbon-nitrogen hydrolase family protein [Isosphaeraceae bacterium]